uniref:Dehydrogenase/reductase SDR family member 1 n=1 Tax=Trichuris muris TaxID=70415 RepID=A0A5S6QET7_TRIMR
MLSGKVALVTGASRGIGRGIALQLAEAGATVYITGRPAHDSESSKGNLPTLSKTAEEVHSRGGKCVPVYCDHSKDEDIQALFNQISEEENGRLDILVNNAFSGVNVIAGCLSKKFWECDPQIWDDMNNVGLRNHYICSVYAARMMAKNKSGLIVNVSSYGGLFYLFNPAYGVGKCACDRMAADCALELKDENVAFLSLWPGFVRTELMTQNMDNVKANCKVFGLDAEAMEELIANAETVEFAGKCVVHLAADKNIMKKTGRILFTADVAREYGFTDVNNKPIECVRSVKLLLAKKNHPTLSALVPSWVRIPEKERAKVNLSSLQSLRFKDPSDVVNLLTWCTNVRLCAGRHPNEQNRQYCRTSVVSRGSVRLGPKRMRKTFLWLDDDNGADIAFEKPWEKECSLAWTPFVSVFPPYRMSLVFRGKLSNRKAKA